MTRETAVLLIRHGESEFLGERLVGRLPHVALTETGRLQAGALPRHIHLYAASIAALYTSPQRRALETAAPIGRAFDVTPQPMQALDEMDFGRWTGLGFRTLDLDPAWHYYNSNRDAARIPGGECVTDVEVRMMRALEKMAMLHAGSTVAIVSHAEVIRTAVLHCCGMRLRDFPSISIDPASISVLRLGHGTARVISVNDRGASNDVTSSRTRATTGHQ